MKKIKTLLLAIMMVATSIPPLAQAQSEQDDCPICHEPSEVFANYIQFAYDMLNNIGSFGTQGNRVGRPTDPGLFQEGALTTDNTNAREQGSVLLMNSINQKMQTATVTALITVNNAIEVTTTDLMLGLTATFKNRRVQRDLEKLYEIDELINAKTLELGQAGSFFSRVTPGEFQAINTTLSQAENTLLQQFTINESVKHGEILDILQKSQRKRKYLIMWGKVSQFWTYVGENNEAQTSQPIYGKSKNIEIRYDLEQIKKATEEYKCGRGVSVCDSNVKSYGKKIGEEAKEEWDQMKEAIKRFGDSAQRLGFLFRGQNKEFKNDTNREKYESFLQRKHELAVSNLGLDGDYTTKQSDSFWDALRKKAKSSINVAGSKDAIIGSYENSLGPLVRGSVDTVKSVSKQIKDITNNSDTFRDINESVANSTGTVVLTQVMKTSLKTTMKKVMASAEKSSSMGNIIDPLPVTQLIPGLCDEVDQVNEVIGNRERKGSIIKNLGIACEKQCANAGGICRY